MKTGETRLSVKLAAQMRYDNHAFPVDVELAYETEDPLAVSMRVASRDDTSNWRFARDLILDGQKQKAGMGAVKAWPNVGMVQIALTGDDGETGIVDLPAAPVRQFARRMASLVPRGKEIVDVDRALAELGVA